LKLVENLGISGRTFVVLAAKDPKIGLYWEKLKAAGMYRRTIVACKGCGDVVRFIQDLAHKPFGKHIVIMDDNCASIGVVCRKNGK
jgi:hypothetical protein